MEQKARIWRSAVIVLLVLILGVGVAGLVPGLVQPKGMAIQALAGDVTNFSGVHIAVPTAVGTATPGLLVNNLGLSQIASFQDGGTEVLGVINGGQISIAGFESIAAPTAIATGSPALLVNNAGVSQIASFQDGGTEVLGIINGGSVSVAGSVAINAPTAVATGVPALEVDSAGVSKILSVRDGNTEVLGVNNGGQIAVAVPTAIGTAVPAVVIDSAAVANSLEIRKAATPVFQVDVDGNVIGYVLQYGSSGRKVVCSSTTITGTGVLAHGLATPEVVLLSLAEDPTGDCAYTSFTNSAAVVTGKVWQTALTPAAATTPVAVNWCVIGVP